LDNLEKYMSSMSYLWTASEWRRYYLERISYLRFLNLVNLICLGGTFLMAPPPVTGAEDPRFFLPAVIMAIDFAMCYVFLDDINEGYFAGIACGIIFGVFAIGMAVGMDSHISVIIPPALAVVTAVLFFWYATRHYAKKLKGLNHSLPQTRGRRRRYA